MLPHNRSYSALLLALLAIALVNTGCSKESRKTSHLEKAAQFFANDQYDQAEIEYMNALRLDPQNAEAISKMAIIFFDQGAVRKSAPFLVKANELLPDDVDISRRVGLLYLQAGEPAKAREEAISILEKTPGHEDGILLLADASTQTNDIHDAKERLTQLKQKTGDSAAYHLATANLLSKQSNTNLADVEKEILQAIKVDPKSGAALTAAGNVYWSQTNLVEAEKCYKAGAEVSPLRSTRRLRYITFKLRNGKLDEAKQLLQELTEKAPDYLPAWNYRAQIAFDEKEYDNSLKYTDRVIVRDPQNYDARTLRGRTFLAQKQADKAVTELERLLSDFARSAPLRYQLALAQMVNNDLPKAIANLDSAISLAPGFSEAVLLRAQISVGKGDYDAAIESLEQLTTRQTNSSQIIYALARAYLGGGRLPEADRAFQRYTNNVPMDPRGPFFLGMIYRQQKDPEAARKAFEQTLKLQTNYLGAVQQLVALDVLATNYPAALDRAEKQVQQTPDSAEAHLLLATVYLAQKDDNQAEKELRKTIELAPTARNAQILLTRLFIRTKRQDQAIQELQEMIAKNPKDVGALMMLSMMQSELKDYSGSRKTLEQLLEAQPKNGLALNNLAYLYAEQIGDLDRAYDLARQARELMANDPFTADTFGWILFKRGDYAEALRLLQESAEKLTAEPDVQYHLGMTHYMMGHEAAAKTAFEMALKSPTAFEGKEESERRLAMINLDISQANPQQVAALEASLKDYPKDMIVLTRLGSIYERQGKADLAIEIYNRALKLNPQALSPTIGLARLYAKKPDGKDTALTFARKARELAPTDPVVAYTLGQLAFQTGDYSWALSLLQESGRRMPNDSDVLYDLAWADYAAGRINEANQDLTKALGSNPQFSRANEAKWFQAMIAAYLAPASLAQAEPQAAQLLKANPNHVPALMVSGLALQSKQQYQPAAQVFEKVLSIYPNFAPAQKYLASLYANYLGDDQKAYALAVKARETLSGDADLAKTLGILSFKRKDARYAVPILQESARTKSTDPEIFYYLGMAFKELNQNTESAKALRKALELNLPEPLAKQARATLDALK